MEDVLLRMEGITKAFPGVKALDGAGLEVRKGEAHALIGENGAGKSTLMKILLGIYKADGGEIIYKGNKVSFASPHDALNNGISMIHQEISLIQSMDVSENVWLGREELFKTGGFLNRKKRYQATKELLKRLEIDLDPSAKVKNLSIAQMQLTEIARAVSYSSDIVIMDEPTSALADAEIQLLFRIIRDLTRQGISVIFISHKLEEIFTVCDRVTVFRDGQFIAERKCNDLKMQELITMIAGRELDSMYPKEPAEIGETVLEVKNFSSTGVFEEISFSVRRGEILGFCGLMGAGRTEIIRAIFGIDPHSGGEVLLEGKPVKIRSPKEAVDLGLGMVTEDRLRMGIIATMSVLANVTLAFFYRICNKLGFYKHSNEQKAFDEIKSKLSIKCSSSAQLISQLSGGNQQKVILARWLLTNPKILFLDEPTRGIDVGSKAEIHRLISNLAGQGIAIVLVSSEMPEVLGMSDRIMVVRQGRIVHECVPKETTQEELISYAFGSVAE